MKNFLIIKILKSVLLFSVLICIMGCKKDPVNKASKYIWDIEKYGTPKFVDKNYIELNKISMISKLRSSISYDYSDVFEDCRNMKQYFEPKINLGDSTIKIYSPVSGTITKIVEDLPGYRVEITSEKYPAFLFSIFHLNLSAGYNIGDNVIEGEQLGYHIDSQSTSSISVKVNDPTEQGKLISYFDVMSDNLFLEYNLRGIINRNQLIISKEERDADTLKCNGGAFITTGTIENWVILN